MLTSVKYWIHAKMELSAGTRLEATNAFASQDLQEKTVKQVNSCYKNSYKLSHVVGVIVKTGEDSKWLKHTIEVPFNRQHYEWIV